MKASLLTILLICFTWNVQAKFYEGTVYLKSGEEKTGFIGSFMEVNIWKKLKPGSKITDEFNLNDATIKFRAARDSEETIKIAADAIREVVFNEGPFAGGIYRPLFVGGVNKHGELELSSKRVWLPLSVDDRIKIYSYKITESGRNGSGSSYMHFLQHPDHDYAIQPLSELGLFQMKGEVITEIALNEMKLLMEDCPEAYAGLEEMASKFKVKEERKKMRKKLKGMRTEAMQNFLSAYPDYGMSLRMFANYYWIICDAMAHYNRECQ
ncbi:MAG: hypothetical protein AAF466_07090 [Bacteroidota bacterium]